MTLIEKIRQIERLHLLIKKRGTGSPAQLAYRLNLSERSVYNLINQMKSMGAPIKFCHQTQSYHYDGVVEFNFGFQLSKDNNRGLNGGNNKINYFALLQEFCSSAVYV